MIPDISYLILNYNPQGNQYGQDVLNQTLDALFSRKSKNLTCEVFLLDQGSTMEHRKWLLEKQNQYRFSTLLLNRNIGISRAINLFVRMCKSPLIGLITADVVITSGMDEDLYRKLQHNEVYQAIPFTDKSDLGYQTWKPKEEFGYDNLDLSGLQTKKESPLNYLRCIGAELNVIFWKKSTFDKVGYFDERWKAGHENNDFFLRCFIAGGCTAISYNSFVWHHHQVVEKTEARKTRYVNYIEGDWVSKTREMWNEKWPSIHSYIDIYKVLEDKTINDYPELYEKFKHNIYSPYEQDIAYF